MLDYLGTPPWHALPSPMVSAHVPLIRHSSLQVMSWSALLFSPLLILCPHLLHCCPFRTFEAVRSEVGNRAAWPGVKCCATEARNRLLWR